MDNLPICNNEEDFARRYSRLVSRCVRPLFLQGADYDDLYQEGMIGLLKAIRSYDKARNDSFEAFATLCIKNQLYDAVRRSATLIKRQKQAENSLKTMVGSDNIAACPSPEYEVMANESAKEIQTALNGLLSTFEASILDPYLEGYTASEIAVKCEKTVKSVENAITRIRRKLGQYLLNGDRRI
ncbi:MAG: sigma-70 family RNA polymerase sigma factor [Angelakisella sp.]